MLEALIIRHGQSCHNTRVTSHLDSPLTEVGVHQATMVGQWLKTNVPNLDEFVGIASPYLRTLQTANFIQKETKLKFLVDSRVAEYDVTQLKVGDIIHVANRYREFSNFNWQLVGIDSLEFYFGTLEAKLLTSRAYLDKLQDNKLVIVTHAFPKIILRDLLLNKPISELSQEYYNKTDFRSIFNCSISWVKNGTLVHDRKIVY